VAGQHREAAFLTEVFLPTDTFVDGLLNPGAHLPVNRLKLDGSMHDW
jgi:hypothetical protein